MNLALPASSRRHLWRAALLICLGAANLQGALCLAAPADRNAEPPVLQGAETVVTAPPVHESDEIVTATRFPGRASDAPSNVRVVTAEDIRRSTATTVAEVLAKLGGVYTRVNFLGIPDSPVDLRGFGITGDQNTLVLVDGVRISENELASARISAIPVNAIQRIEILPGSGAVLYGSGATGGVINIITQSAQLDARGERPGSASLLLGAGSYGGREARASLSGGTPLWGLTISANRSDAENYRVNNAAHQRNLDAELRREIDQGVVALRLIDDRQEARLPGARSAAQVTQDPRGTATPQDYANLNGSRWGLVIERRFGLLTASLDLGLRDKHSSFFNGDYGFGSNLMDTTVREESVSPRLRWQDSVAGIDNVLVIGMDYANWNYHAITQTDNPSYVSPRDETGNQRNRAFYLSDQMHLSSAWSLSLGARRELLAQASDERLTPLPHRLRSYTLNASELGTRYQWSSTVALYARSGLSFRVANVDENRCYAPPCGVLLEPQRSHDSELGLEWHQEKRKLVVSLFQSRLSDELYFNAITFTNLNLPPTRRSGLDINGYAEVARDWDLNLHYSYTVAQFQQGAYNGFDANFNPVGLIALAGQDVPLVPRQRATLNVGYQASPHWRLGSAVSLVGPQVYDNDPANRFNRMPGYALVDVKLAYSAASYTLSAAINNLLDRAYYSYAIVNSAYQPSTFNAYPETRRNVHLSAEFPF